MNKSKIAITTDTSSGLSKHEWEDREVYVLPIPFIIDGEEYLEGVSLNAGSFFEKQEADANISTSQPSVGDLTELWTELLKSYDYVVHIPISAGLSQSLETAQIFAKEFDGRVEVVNNRRISITLKESVNDAVLLRERGLSAREIKERLEANAYNSSIYLAVDNIKYLKKGGRVTPAAAMVSTLLNIKPVLSYSGEKIDKFTVARSMKKAKETVKKAIREALNEKYAEYARKGEMVIELAYGNNPEFAEELKKEIEAEFSDIPLTYADTLSLCIACHTGGGVFGVAVTRREI